MSQRQKEKNQRLVALIQKKRATGKLSPQEEAELRTLRQEPERRLVPHDSTLLKQREKLKKQTGPLCRRI